MYSFKVLLKEFDEVLRKYNLPNYVKLKDPLSLTEIDNYFNRFNIKCDELHQLYEWKDGFDSFNRHERCDIMKFCTFLSLESISQEINYYSKQSLWTDSFIPIINDFSGSYILYNTDSGPENGKLFLFSPSLLFVEPITYYDSVYTMIETTIEAYKKGVFKYDSSENWLNIDIYKFHEIGKRINKNSKYWAIEKHEW